MATTRPPPKKVLYVHNGDNIESHRKHLTDSGVEVFEAYPEHAVASAIASEVDIVVLDFAVDGETVAALKANEATRDIPVIALAELGLT